DLDLVVILELDPVLDELVVDEGAVAALHVLDEELALLANDVRVGPADGGAIDDHMAIGVASEDELVALKWHNLHRRSSFLHLQRSHTAPHEPTSPARRPALETSCDMNSTPRLPELQETALRRCRHNCCRRPRLRRR